MARGPETAVVDRIPLIENEFCHDLSSLEGTLLPGEEIVDMHGAGVHVFEIGASLGDEHARVRTIHPGMRPDEMRSVIGRFDELPVAGANVHFVPTGGSVKKPMVKHRAVDILKRPGKALLHEAIVKRVGTGFCRRNLRPNHPGVAEPLGRNDCEHAWSLQSLGVYERFYNRDKSRGIFASRFSEGHLYLLCLLALQIRLELNLNRPDGSILSIDPPWLERAHGGSNLPAASVGDADQTVITEEPGCERQAEVDNFAAEVFRAANQRDGDLPFRLGRLRTVHAENASGKDEKKTNGL